MRILRVLGEAYSLKQIAESKPKGKATKMEIPEVKTVALMRTKIPKLALLNKGVHLGSVKKFQKGTSLKNSKVSKIKVKTIPAVVAMETRAHRAQIALTTN